MYLAKRMEWSAHSTSVRARPRPFRYRLKCVKFSGECCMRYLPQYSLFRFWIGFEIWNGPGCGWAHILTGLTFESTAQ